MVTRKYEVDTRSEIFTIEAENINQAMEKVNERLISLGYTYGACVDIKEIEEIEEDE